MKQKTFNRNKQLLTLAVNGVIFLSVLAIAGMGIFRGAGKGQVGDGVVGLGYFKPFTIDSNILAGISSLIVSIFCVKSLLVKRNVMPKWAAVLQLMGAASLTLTMVTAALFLGPMKVLFGESYFSMFANDMFFFHLLNPVLSIISFTCLNTKFRFMKRESILGMIPTIIYSFVYLTMVVILKKWADFYNFTFGGRVQFVPFVFIVIYAIVLTASLLLIRGHNRRADDQMIRKEGKFK